MSPALPVIDLDAPDAQADPHALFHRLRAEGPLHWSERHRAWVAVSHRAVTDGFRDKRLSSDRIGAFEKMAARRPAAFARVVDLFRGWMVFRDPPDHTRLREPVKRAFTPRTVADLAPSVERTTEQLLDRLADEGSGDLRDVLARPLPALVIADLLGVPRADRVAFQGWSDRLASLVFTAESGLADDGAVMAAADEFTAYFGGLVADRRERPGDDLVSVLAEVARADEPGLSDVELVGACTLLLFAGHETTGGLISNGAAVLLGRPDVLADLAGDPDLWPVAGDELCRYEGPAKTMVRRATEDFDWHGRAVAAGDAVYLAIGAANRDPEMFADPDTLDIGRDPNPHVGFGWGLHHCLGASLARMEAGIALRRLFERFPAIELVDEPGWGGGVLGRGVGAIRVRV